LFAKLLSPLDTLTRALQGPDATLHTVNVLSESARASIADIRNNLDGIVADAVQLATISDINTEPVEKRVRKVSRRINIGNNETTLSPLDELKKEM